MRFVLERVTQPSTEPVTYAEFVEHLREYQSLPQATQDKLSALLVVARQWAEEYTGRALVEQSWRLSLTDSDAMFRVTDTNAVTGIFTPRPEGIYLRKSPAVAITSFVTLDSTGAEVTIDPTTYQLRDASSKYPRIFPLTGSWETGSYRIVFRAGYASGLGSPDPSPVLTSVPQRFKQAIMLYAEALYDREDFDQTVKAAENLITPERCEMSFA